MDLPRLLSELPKYKPWLSASAWSEWEDFMAASDNLTDVPDNTWDLQKLISVSIISSHARNNVPPPISEELTRILSKEKSAPPKVCLLVSG